MDASTNYLAQAKDTKDGAKAVVEAPDEEIVVFANGNSNGLKSTNKAPTADSKIAPGGSETSDGAAEGPPADGTASTQTTPADSDAATGLADAFKTLSVNSKPDTKFEYASLNDYRPSAKYPTISVPPHGDVNGSAGLEWQHQQPKIGRKAAEEPSYGAAPPLYGRPLNASASDFQHRGAPTPAYPGYGAPGAGAYGSYQHGIPPIHGSYVNHGYDVFGVSPTLTEPPVSGGVPGGPNPPAANGSNAPGNRYAPPAHRNSANAADPSGMGLNLNGLGGAPNPAPYSPIPMSPSPLSLNPYAAHHHAQMQLNHAHMNGHPMGAAYIPPPGAPAKTDANGAPALGTTPGQNNANAVSNATGGPAASGTARGYAPPTQPFNVPGLPYGVTAGQQYYDESAIYAGYAAPHIQHSIHHPHTVHPQYQLNPQLGPPGHPGTPQLGGYGGYMPGPMVGVPGVGNPGMLPVPGGVAGGPGGPNGGATNHANGGPGGVQHGANVNGSAANGAPSVTTTVNGLTLVNGVPQPNADGTGPSANNRKLGLYKTELCRSWEEKGSCRYGPKCQFAHGEDEIRKVARHPKYKTEICRTFWLSGSCPYGKRCCFIHTDAPTSNSGDANKAGSGTGPSTAAVGGAAANPPSAAAPATADGTSTPTHTRTTSTASEANTEQPPSSLLARISAKRAGEGDKTPSPQGPPRINPNVSRPDFSHNRHVSSMSDGRPAETEGPAAPTFNPRPGHSHSASAHTLMTPTFSTPGGSGLGFSAAQAALDGNGNLTPGSFWGHKRSASGSSVTNATWSTPANEVPTGTQPEQPLRSIYSSLSPAA